MDANEPNGHEFYVHRLFGLGDNKQVRTNCAILPCVGSILKDGRADGKETAYLFLRQL